MPRNGITIHTTPPAGHYAAPNEKIIEFSSPAGSGLISFLLRPDGRLNVHVYRQDLTVIVTAGDADTPVRSGNLRQDRALYEAARAFVADYESRHSAPAAVTEDDLTAILELTTGPDRIGTRMANVRNALLVLRRRLPSGSRGG